MPRTPSQPSVDSDLVRSLAQLLDENRLTEIEFEQGGLRIRVARQSYIAAQVPSPGAAPAPIAPAAPAAAVAAVDPAAHPGAVKSPMVGVVYLSPDPASARFFTPGETVTEGQTLLLIEAMKNFNPIRAPRAGRVSQLLVEDGQPVEFGEPLLVIE